MKLHYYPETDTLYVDLVDRPSERSIEVSPNVVLDVDTDGQPVGIEIEHAVKLLDLDELEAESASERIAVLRFIPSVRP